MGPTADRPGSILYGQPSLGSSGTSSANALTDAKRLVAEFFNANPDPTAATWIMGPRAAAAYAVAANTPTLTVRGGSLLGLPAVVSHSAGSVVAIIDAGQLLVADRGELTFDLSRNATIEMRGDVTSPSTESIIAVSLWQTGLVGFKVSRTINWKLKPGAAIYTVQGGYV